MSQNDNCDRTKMGIQHVEGKTNRVCTKNQNGHPSEIGIQPGPIAGTWRCHRQCRGDVSPMLVIYSLQCITTALQLAVDDVLKGLYGLVAEE
jgi:hypothetical protein